jgi:hypothetical protein
MGEIIIKVPDDVKEVIEINLPLPIIKEKIDELRENKAIYLAKFILKNAGRIEDEDLPSEEETYLQGD